MNNNQPEVKTFDCCPNCGSTERFVADLARKEGLDNPEMYGLNCRPEVPGPQGFVGPVIDNKGLAAAIIGHEFPIFAAPIDACKECGLVYTIRQEVHKGKKMLPPAVPGRRAVSRGQMPSGPFLPGPF